MFEVELNGYRTVSHDKGGGFTGQTERGEMLEKDFVPQRLLWRWQRFNDDMVQPVTEREVLHGEGRTKGYLYFYVHEGLAGA